MQINNFIEPQNSKENINNLYFKQEKEDAIDSSEQSMPAPKNTMIRKRP